MIAVLMAVTHIHVVVAVSGVIGAVLGALVTMGVLMFSAWVEIAENDTTEDSADGF